MSYWEGWLLTGVVVAALVSWGNWRAWAWLALGVFDYLITSAWADAGLPMHSLFSGIVDFNVCFIIVYVCELRGGQFWEVLFFFGIALCFLANFAEMIVTGGNALGTLYRLSLEGGNWIAILSVAGSGTLRWADALDPGVGRHLGYDSRLHRLVEALYTPALVRPSSIVKAIFRAATRRSPQMG
jgi:hypothetical protein